MIGYLKGKVVWSTPSRIILSVQDFGYEINYFARTLSSLDNNEVIELFIVQKTSEFGVALYGFRSIEEKLIFETLDSIKGVSSRAIFNIMGTIQITRVEQLRELELKDLTVVPGVGKTTAQKFLLALSTKLKKEFQLELMDEKEVAKDSTKAFENEINLLVDWGMKKSQITELFTQNAESLKGKSSEQIIKFALQNLR